MQFWDQLNARYRQFNSAEKLIVVNLICFILPLFLRTFLFLFNIPFEDFLQWFELSAGISDLLWKPWSLITYSFLHSGFFHLFWNMLLLYYAGRLFLNLFPATTFYNLYFLGVLAGALIFILSYAIFPAFKGVSPVMVGASAGVMAVLIFSATYTPDQEVRVFFFNLKLRYLGMAFVLLDVIQIPYGNAGGHLAHIGGAALGFFYARKLGEGVDIGVPFENLMRRMLSLFKTQPTLRTVHKAQKSKTPPASSIKNKSERQKRIDLILDKISRSGYDSLAQQEKDELFHAGKED